MKISKKLVDGRLSIKVEGRLDTNTSPELEAELAFDGVSKLVFDFSGLEYISSAGLRVLLFAKKSMASVGGAMEIVGSNDAVRSVFEITGCSEIFSIS